MPNKTVQELVDKLTPRDLLMLPTFLEYAEKKGAVKWLK